MKHFSAICINGAATIALLCQSGAAMAVPDDTAAERAVPHPQPAAAAVAKRVAPPPRPAGSEQAVVAHGESPDITLRNRRAHRDRTLMKKDLTHDDTLDTPAPANGKQ